MYRDNFCPSYTNKHRNVACHILYIVKGKKESGKYRWCAQLIAIDDERRGASCLYRIIQRF